MVNKAKEQMLCLACRRGSFPVFSQPCGKPHIYMFAFEFLPYKHCSEQKRNDQYNEDRS
jgi:hypothetical protein